MPGNRRFLWYCMWLPLVVAAGVIPALVAVLLLGSSPAEAKAAITAENTAGFQTTDKLVITVNLPAEKRAGKLKVEVVDADGTASSAGITPAATTKGSHTQNHRKRRLPGMNTSVKR